MVDEPGPAAQGPPAPSHDTIIAIRSAATLGASLVVTWSVGLLVRLYLPRYLGPEVFGTYNFADSFAATCFIALGLGVETYMMKELPTRPEHASDFFGGILVARLGMTAGLFGVMALVLSATHRPPEVTRAILVFGVAQFFVQLSTLFSSMLQAARTVGGLALVNVASKVLWGLGIVVAIALRGPFMHLAVAFLLAEVVKAAALYGLARKHLALRARLDFGALRLVVVASLPFYLNAVAGTVYSKLDVTILTFVSNDTEVGWYGSAQNLSSIAMMLTPLMAAVLTPLLSRAVTRSEAEMVSLLRRTIETIMTLAFPVSLMMGIGADVWVRYAFGPAFGPATASVAILSPTFVLTYLAMILAMFLVVTGRSWTVTLVSVLGLVVDASLNVLTVPAALRFFGPGGAGIAASAAMVMTESLIVLTFVSLLRARCFDRRNLRVVGKTLGVALVVAGLDRLARPLGPARLLLDGAAYLGLAVGTGALAPRELVGVLRASRHPARG